MSLFETAFEMIGIRPKLRTESTYSYYARSERASMTQIRKHLNSWFEELPPDGTLDVLKRFRSSVGKEHEAAFFEIYLQRLFTRMGFELRPHPDLKTRASHPDYLVVRNSQPVLYLEATVTTDSVAEAGAQKRVDQAYEALDKLDSPDFYLSIEVEGSPRTPPPGADLRQQVAKWLKTLDYQSIRARWEIDNLSAGPLFKWEHDGWGLTIAPIPKTPEQHGSQGLRAIGITLPSATQIYLEQDIRKAIEAKSRYGSMDHPFVIAINVLDEFRVDRIDLFNALFGDETWIAGGGQTAYPGPRVLNGAWFSGRGPTNTKVSAVMVFTNLVIANARDQEPWIVHNPWAKNPLPFDALPLSQLVPDRTQNNIVEQKGNSCSLYLGLPEPWPPDED